MNTLGGTRRDILWVGSYDPDRLSSAAHSSGLTVRCIALEDVGPSAPSARMLIVDIPDVETPDFVARASTAISLGRTHGLLTVLACGPERPPGVHFAVDDADDTMRRFRLIREIRNTLGQQIPVCYKGWVADVAGASAFEPGPGANPELRLEGEVPEDEHVRILFRRAFSDLSGVHIRQMVGGRSNAGVWLVHPSADDAGRRHMPFVVKVHHLKRIADERANARLIQELVDPRRCAVFDERRSLDGDAVALAVYSRVHGASMLEALALRPSIVVTSLFRQSLIGVHASAMAHERRLADAFGRDTGQLNVLRWESSTLKDAAERACGSGIRALPMLADLQGLVAGLPAMTVQMGTVHGDLHAGNLFVSGEDVMMIDYGSVLRDAPIIADMAEFEVSVAWPSAVVPGERPDVGETWLRAAYSRPLSSTLPRTPSPEDAWLPEALSMVRLFARLVEPNTEVYDLAVAFNLLRFASFDDNGNENDRALAYELAAMIIGDVHRGMAATTRADVGRSRAGEA